MGNFLLGSDLPQVNLHMGYIGSVHFDPVLVYNVARNRENPYPFWLATKFGQLRTTFR